MARKKETVNPDGPLSRKQQRKQRNQQQRLRAAEQATEQTQPQPQPTRTPSPSPSPTQPAQPQSPLFRLPLNIREAIYRRVLPRTIHFTSGAGGIGFMTCIAPDDDHHDAKCSNDDVDRRENEVCSRKWLTAPVASHERCQNAEYTRRLGPYRFKPLEFLALMATCKDIYREVRTTFAEEVGVVAQDLTATAWLARARPSFDHRPTSPYHFLRVMRAEITNLAIAIREDWAPGGMTAWKDLKLITIAARRRLVWNDIEARLWAEEVWPAVKKNMKQLRTLDVRFECRAEWTTKSIDVLVRPVTRFVEAARNDKATLLRRVRVYGPKLPKGEDCDWWMKG